MENESDFKFPNDSQRICIVGATGSGKTVAALWHLSERSFTQKPWVVYDFKGDEHIEQINAIEIGVDSAPPTKPGIYVVRPLTHETDEVSAQMMAIWSQGNTGVYVDEGYMVGRACPGFRTLLTQGRSRKTPLIVLAQRPVMLDRFVFTESNFFQVFRLQSERDGELVADFIPPIGKLMLGRRADRFSFSSLPAYESLYYQVGSNSLFRVEPGPTADDLIEIINLRLENIPQN